MTIRIPSPSFVVRAASTRPPFRHHIPDLLLATRGAAATGLIVLAFTACLPWNGGGDCPYGSDQQIERLDYDWGNGKGLLLREEVESLPKDALVGDNDLWDHQLGYRDGYFHGVLNAKFGKPNKPSPDYPEVEAYVGSYDAGLADGYAIATERSGNERLAFAAGFADGLLDGKNLCE